MVLTLRNHFTILPFAFLYLGKSRLGTANLHAFKCLPPVLRPPPFTVVFKGVFETGIIAGQRGRHSHMPRFRASESLRFQKACILVRNACPLWQLAHDPCNVASNCRQLPVLVSLVLNRPLKRSGRIAGSCKRRLTTVGFYFRDSVKRKRRRQMIYYSSSLRK